jgi:hypothetical protein
MKTRLGEEKEKNCSPITKERETREENNLHWFQKQTKKFEEEKTEKKGASMRRWLEGKGGKKCLSILKEKEFQDENNNYPPIANKKQVEWKIINHSPI